MPNRPSSSRNSAGRKVAIGLVLAILVAIGAAPIVQSLLNTSGHSAAPTTKTPTASAPTPSKYERVLFAGDSLTVGRDANELPQSFRVRVADELRATGTKSITTIAKSGARLSYIAQSKKLPAKLDLALIELGTNDIRLKTPVKEFRVQYQNYMKKIKASSPGVKLVCLGVWHDPKAEITRSLDLVIKDVCAQSGGSYVQLTDLYSKAGTKGPAGATTWNGTSDALHPNTYGHQAIATKLIHELNLTAK